jgi:hypothetical protein
VASNKNIAILTAVLKFTVWLLPDDILPVKATSAGPLGVGGIKKSSVLVAVPFGVLTDNFPEPLRDGTVVEILESVAELTTALVILNLVLFFTAGV